MLALIALRNLSRNRRRTALSLSVVSVGFVGILLTAGFVRHSFEGLGDAVIRGGLGHLEVAPASDREAAGSPADPSGRPPGLSGWRVLRDAIERRPHVRAAGAAIQFVGVATNGDHSASFVGIAVEPDRERLMGMDVRLRQGVNLSESQAEDDNAVLLGLGLARALTARPGDTLTVMASTPDASLNAVDMRVVGVFTTGIQELDSRVMKTGIATAQRLLDTDNVSSLVVGLSDAGATADAALDLRHTFGAGAQALAVTTWETRAPFYGQVRRLYTGIFVFLGTIVAILVVLSTSNTMLMSVLERVREFGTLLAIGTSRSQIAQMLVFEALWLSLCGGILGSSLGVGAVMGLNAAEIDMPPPPGAVDPIQLALVVVPADFLWIMAGLTCVLVAAVLPPLVRVFRMQIVDSLGHV